MGIVFEYGINDMPKYWYLENEWNKKVYSKWCNMLMRVYSEKFHDKNPTYINSTLQLELHWLSYFVEHFKEITGYDEEKFLNGELELDKDIKSNGHNKEYSLENCMLVSKSENSKQANKTRDNTYLQGENHIMYGKHHSEKTKKKISKSNTGKKHSDESKKKISIATKGENNPMYNKKHTEESINKMKENRKGKNKGKNNYKSKQVAQYDLNGNLIKIWNCVREISYAFEEINYSTIRSILQGRTKSNQYKGYIWKYYSNDY